MELTIEQLVAEKTTTTIDPRASDAQIAINPNTSQQVLHRLAIGTDWELRRLVASNPNTPTEILWQLGIDFPEAILSNPIFELLQLGQLRLVAEIPHATLTSLLQCERVPRSFMEYAVSQQDYSLWLAVAYNPQAPSNLLENLARRSRHQDRELIRAIAAHPQTPDHLLVEIIDISVGVAQIVAENARTPVAVLAKILQKYGTTSGATFTTLVALHPQIDPQQLIQMHLAPSESAAQSLWVAKQITTTSSQLMELAQTDWLILQLAIVRHPHTPAVTIDRIWQQMRLNQQLNAAAETLSERLMYDSFVSNPNTSAQIRSELRKLLQW